MPSIPANCSSIVDLGFIVKNAGMLSLIQDEGRFGSFNLGLTNGGPIDKTAFAWANRLCGNEFNTSAIEISVGGLSLIAQVDTVIALTGAPMPLTINSQVKELWRSYHIKAGDVIKVGYASSGFRSYLSVKGGFSLDSTFGSTSTVCREGVGGINGEKLKINDILPCQTFPNRHHSQIELFALAKKNQPRYNNEITLRTVPSYQQQHFSRQQQRLFYSSEYRVSKNFDRMGYRLEGQTIESELEGILSEGICHGAVQIPTDGQPIVLLNDRQTIGGYPKIGAVIALDTAKLSQLHQGGKVNFEAISMESAYNLFHLSINQFNDTQLIKCN